RHFSQALGHLGGVLEQLREADRASQSGRARTDDQHPYLDRLRVGGLRDHLRHRERRRVVGRAWAHAFLARTSSVSLGTISCRSPTTPRSQNSKIGAFGSLFTATIVPDPCIPTLCWIAPEVPHA